MAETVERRESGFEYDGQFYTWQVSDVGKDLLLVDMIAKIPITEFFQATQDPVAQKRSPIILAMIACSIRAAHPDWTVERIDHLVKNLSLGSDITVIEGDTEEQLVPPAETEEAAPTPLRKPRAASSQSSTPEETSPSATSSAIPA